MGLDLMKVPAKIKRFCLSHTRKGKVDKLEQLTRSLTTNTALVTKKYEDLKIVQTSVKETLEKLTSETFERENIEIEGLDLISKEEQDRFKGALIKIRDTGIAELKPISEIAQRIKAHMLVTLNKALIQKAILIAKSKLASNAHLQLDTLKIIEKETSYINVELKDLLKELDVLNEGAINTVVGLKLSSKGLSNNEEVNIVEHIFKKLEAVKKTT